MGHNAKKPVFLLCQEGIKHKHPNDFLSHRGTYAAMLDHKFAIIAKKRSDFALCQIGAPLIWPSTPKLMRLLKPIGSCRIQIMMT